jgi:hypothetical protein
MLGAFHEIWRMTGQRPNIITSEEFCSIYEGASYVNAVPVPAKWDSELNVMKTLAGWQFADAIGIQPWHDMDSPEFSATRGVRLESHGRPFVVDLRKYPHYGAAMMLRAGFSWDEAMSLRPVFDRRNPQREIELIDRHWPKAFRIKPLLLVALDGRSSPWGYLPEAYPVLLPFYRHFHVVDLAKLRAVRIFDILGLMEQASGAIVIDTMLLHLFAATETPYVAFTKDGWSGSVPKGNCVLDIPYHQSLRRLPEVCAVLKHWLRERSPKPMLVSQIG